ARNAHGRRQTNGDQALVLPDHKADDRGGFGKGAGPAQVDGERGRARARGSVHGRARADAEGMDGETPPGEREIEISRQLRDVLDEARLRAATRRGSGTLRSKDSCATSRSLSRCMRVIGTG